ncbi:60S ribosomal protein L15 [Trifolium repens]|jgi:large subunit ribosomal protein L15|nr:60S ribosomal protein L15 [Trifolium repens]
MSAAVAFLIPVSSIPSLASPFKGNVKTLVAKPFLCPCLKIQRTRPRVSVVVNKAGVYTTTTKPGGENVRFRLDNLGPQPGSRKRAKRKGRGISAGQGASCGFGMRGQKSRSGPGIMRGFEGGQMPLYRRLPKLRGIAGGMHAGLPKYVNVNLEDIENAGFQEGEEVSLETLKEKRVINPSGRERKLPLKILGDGELSKKLTIKARAFSTAAKEKLESAGCSLTVLPGRKKWVKSSITKNNARAEEYFAKKREAPASEPASA